MKRAIFVRYSLAQLVVAAGVIVGGLLWRPVTAAIGCGVPAQSGSFLAYCDHPDLGDYEHAAYAFSIERNALDALRAADVLFLGSSRAQFGFSTASTRTFFDGIGLRHYVFGFGYFEQSRFPLHIIERERLRPAVVVIANDQFFSDYISPPARAALHPTVNDLVTVLPRATAMKLATALCLSVSCAATSRSIYRNPHNGHWEWVGTFSPGQGALPVRPAPPEQTVGPGWAPSMADDVRALLSRLHADPQCVVLTETPNSLTDSRELTLELGRLMGVPVILPEVSALLTIDDSHLDQDSAERWSAALLRDAGSIISRCAQARQSRGGPARPRSGN